MRGVLVGMAAVAVGAGFGSGCGGVTCGTGTVQQNGQCVPASISRCGAGTVLEGTECKPTAVVCAAGTLFKDGKCVPASVLVCGPGTVENEGKCVAADPMLRVTDAESPEPNQTAESAKRFVLPAVGAPAPIVLGGTIDAPTDAGADVDVFVFAATAGQRIHVAATAVGAPEVAVVVAPAVHPEGLPRYVMSLSSRTAERDLVLPATGDWLLTVGEASNFQSTTPPMPRGGPAYTFTVDVTQVAAIAPAELVADAGSGTYAATGVFRVPGGASATLAKMTFDAPATGAAVFEGLRAVWAWDQQSGKLVFAATDTLTASGSLRAMDNPLYLPVPTAGVFLGVDYVVAGGQLDAAYGFKIEPMTATEATLPFSEPAGDLGGDGIDVYWVDVPDNAVLKADIPDMGEDVTARLEIRDANFALAASHESSYRAKAGAYVGTGAGGRWYVIVRNLDTGSYVTDTGYKLTITGGAVVPMDDLAVPGTVTSGGNATANNPLWFSLKVTGNGEVAVTATPGSVDVGVFGTDLKAVASKNGTGGTATTAGGIVGTPGLVLLVSLTADADGAVTVSAEARSLTPMTEIEPNDTVAGANANPQVALSFDSTVAITGTLSSRTDVDYFVLTIPGNDAVTLVASTGPGLLHQTPDTKLWLQDAAGSTTITYNDDIDFSGGNYWSHIEKTALQPGTYMLKNTCAGSTFGEYVLMISITATP